jgi:hypothetical protein
MAIQAPNTVSQDLRSLAKAHNQKDNNASGPQVLGLAQYNHPRTRRHGERWQ